MPALSDVSIRVFTILVKLGVDNVELFKSSLIYPRSIKYNYLGYLESISYIFNSFSILPFNYYYKLI